MLKRLLMSAPVVLLLISATAFADARTRAKSHKILKTRILQTQTASPARSGQRAVIDPATKKLREPTADEAQVDGLTLATTPIRETRYSDGTVQLEVTDGPADDVIAVRAPDGTVKVTCVPHEANGAPAPAALETK